MKNRRAFTLRIDDELLHKVHYIAERNKRSVNNQIEYLLDGYVARYENEHGDIDTPQDYE